jgi:hypothetical protein
MARRFHRGWRAVTSPRTTWGRVALLVIAAILAVSIPALSYVAASASGGVIGRWNHFSTAAARGGYQATDLGCAKRRSAANLDDLFSDRFGPIVAMDSPHVIELGRGRHLWLFNDTFVDYSTRAASLLDMKFISNVAVLQEDRCFRLFRQGDGEDILPFMPTKSKVRFFWPLGGEVFGERLHLFWAEMISTRDKPHISSDGLNRHPVRTWLATYDASTLERLSFRPAPNDGVFPQYGYAVASDDRFSYLFGNSNLLDYSLEGGFFGGPHSATKMYVARVPRGQLDRRPEYRTAGGWSDEPGDAVPFSERFVAENGMQPRYMDGHWIAVTKVDGFSGTDTILEVANKPWGPWRIVSERTIEPFRGFDVMNNYQPIILPYRDPSGDLIIVMSQNAHRWPDAVSDFSMYRPYVYSEPWPF